MSYLSTYKKKSFIFDLLLFRVSFFFPSRFQPSSFVIILQHTWTTTGSTECEYLNSFLIETSFSSLNFSFARNLNVRLSCAIFLHLFSRWECNGKLKFNTYAEWRKFFVCSTFSQSTWIWNFLLRVVFFLFVQMNRKSYRGFLARIWCEWGAAHRRTSPTKLWRLMLFPIRTKFPLVVQSACHHVITHSKSPPFSTTNRPNWMCKYGNCKLEEQSSDIVAEIEIGKVVNERRSRVKVALSEFCLFLLRTATKSISCSAHIFLPPKR